LTNDDKNRIKAIMLGVCKTMKRTEEGKNKCDS